MSAYRGQQANTPQGIPLRGWWDILRRTVKKMLDDNLSLIAAGVGFYFLLAVFPLLEAALSTGALLSTLFAIWSASKGAQAMVTASNITYGQKQNRGFLMMLFMRVALTLSAILVLCGALFSIAVLPIILSFVGLKNYSSLLVTWLTWPILAVVFNITLASFYRYGPHRSKAKWRWVTPGSVLASTLWIAFSFGFSFYLGQFGQYDKTYGSLGSVVVLLMWFYLTAYIILLGAEFNAAMEHQTKQDSTHGADKSFGERGAFVADTRPSDLHDKE